MGAKRIFRDKDIKKEFNVKFPSSLSLELDDDRKMITLNMESADAAYANMQENKAAFEGWLLLLKYGPKFKNISHYKYTLNWENPKCMDKTDKCHYQRFLYRVYKFSNIFEWFTIDKKLLGDSKIHWVAEKDIKSNRYIMNVADKDRPKNNKNDSENSFILSEHDLEVLFVWKYSEYIKEITGSDYMSRQWPVGLFLNKKEDTENASIFTGKHSAIDIWGISKDRKTINIIELKKYKNETMGILSELFFYTMVVKDLLTGEFIFVDQKKYINDVNIVKNALNEIECINAFTLTTKLHPEILKEIFDSVNKNEKIKKMNIHFESINYNEYFKCSKTWIAT